MRQRLSWLAVWAMTCAYGVLVLPASAQAEYNNGRFPIAGIALFVGVPLAIPILIVLWIFIKGRKRD